jgi:predicted O-linked N-acetylglucosamine transferase (SPINDLY family)
LAADDLKAAAEHFRLGNLEEARRLFLAYCEHHPANAQVLRVLSQICYQTGRLAESVVHLDRARAVAPSDAGIWFSLGALYGEQRETAKAINCYKESLRLQPNNDEAWSNLGAIYYEQFGYSESIECLQRAVKINNKNEKAVVNLSLSLMAVGNAIEADRVLRAARDTAPDSDKVHSLFVFNLNYLTTPTKQEIFDEHRRWARRYDDAARPDPDWIRRRQDGKKIRVAYISPDIRRHSVAYFVSPVLKAHDKAKFEVYGYSDVKKPDDVTRELMGVVDHWRDISQLDNARISRMIREDEIDILVDLAGHTSPASRILLFANRAAPVQVSWLGYPDTTGLLAMDYRLTDTRTDPEGEADAFYTEKLVRLEEGFLCYEPATNAPAPGVVPIQVNGFVTFGSFNNILKVSDRVVRAWSEILRRIPDARLILKSRGLYDASARAAVLSRFQEHGSDVDRIECLGHVVGHDDHLGLYNRVDIALDTFPYSGTTTTCEAMWMGVPVITLEGDRHVSRVGASLLATVGLADCIANRVEAYIERAVALAGDVPRLGSLRAGLRDRMRGSPLMDAPGFTRNLEGHYRRFVDNLQPA